MIDQIAQRRRTVVRRQEGRRHGQGILVNHQPGAGGIDRPEITSVLPEPVEGNVIVQTAGDALEVRPGGSGVQTALHAGTGIVDGV
jgi:hypothetical protein